MSEANSSIYFGVLVIIRALHNMPEGYGKILLSAFHWSN